MGNFKQSWVIVSTTAVFQDFRKIRFIHVRISEYKTKLTCSNSKIKFDLIFYLQRCLQ